MNLRRAILYLSLAMAHVILASVSTTFVRAQKHSQPQTTIEEYVRTLIDRHWEQAAHFWHPEHRRLADRLGISYQDQPFKYDCASPVLNNLEGIIQGQARWAIIDESIRPQWTAITVALIANSDTISTTYTLVKEHEQWYLVGCYLVFGEKWPAITTAFTRVHCADTTRLNRYALRRLDTFIDSICHILHISENRIERLQREKIEYYLCSRRQMDSLVGPAAQGMVDLPLDIVVSRHLPHEHELVHLLLNYALDSLPMYTVPWIQEGCAVSLGGRWGKRAEPVFLIGRFALADGLLDLPDILTHRGFHFDIGAADISYAVSGLFCRFLHERLGTPQLLELYHQLSAPGQTTREIGRSEIKSTISSKCGQSWEAIENDFAAFWPSFEYHGLVPGDIVARPIESREVRSPTLVLTIKWNHEFATFSIRSRDSSRTEGVILISDSISDSVTGFRSTVAAKHLPDHNYTGEHFGIQFTPEEVGLYDYLTNTLNAKYIYSFSPDDSYWQPDRRILTFSLERRYLPAGLENMRFQLVEVGRESSHF